MKPTWLHLCGGVRPSNEYTWYDTNSYDGEALVWELCGMGSTPSLLLLQGPIWPSMVESVRVSSMSQIELFIYIKLNNKY